jgi:hypothetical protein
MRFFSSTMERGMKSDTTEMVLLGAAAAVIALVVAFSMMDDKGKRSLDDPVEVARNVRQKVEEVEAEVEAQVVELENAGEKIEAETSKAENIVKNLRPLVTTGGRADRVLTKAEGLLEKGKGLGNAIKGVIGEEKAQELKEAAGEKVKSAAMEYGGRALGYFKREIGKGVQQNLKPKPGGFFSKIFQTPQKQPLPEGIEMDRYS